MFGIYRRDIINNVMVTD